MTPSEQLAALLPEWLPAQRWFAAKGRTIRSVEVVARTPLVTDGEPAVDHVLAGVAFDDGPVHHYQLLVAAAPAPGVPARAVIGGDGDTTLYDGLWDPRVADWLLDAVRDGRTVGDLRFVPEPGADLPRGPAGRVLGAEQSNTSVAWGDRTIFKLFRRVLPGVNPDLELHRALRGQGSEQVAALQGAVEGAVEGAPATLGIVQDFAAGATDGWTLALATVRAGVGEPDFTAEAELLGETVAAVHAELARALGTGVADPAALVAGWQTRLTDALAVVPGLAGHETAIRAAYDACASASTSVPVHRVHGDLHLGQTLRTADRWLVIDFEGEPSAPLAERTRPDSPLRDVAGMLRSFDYAAFHEVLRGTADGAAGVEAAAAWAVRTRNAFGDGYARGAGADPRADPALLRAFELDKAVYETVYETRNRPSWAPIPMASVRRLAPGTDTRI